MQSLHTRQYSFEKAYCTNTTMKSHNIVSKKRIMQLLHLDLAEQKLDQKKNKNSIKKNK